MRRAPKLEYFDRVFEELAKGPKRWNELKEATNIPEKTLSRILERISKWGVVSKNEEGKWILNVYAHLYYRTFKSEEEKRLYLKHSEELLPGLYRLLQSLGAISKIPLKDLGFKKDEIILEKLEECARSHIKTGYPELWEKIKRCCELWRKIADLIESISPDLSIVVTYDIPLKKTLTEEFDDFLSKIVCFPWKSLVKIKYKRQVSRLIKMKEELLNLLKEIYGELILLILKIEKRGEPLLGECPYCPRITVER